MMFAAAVVTVVALGDSVTYGVRPDGSVTREQSFVGALARMLRARYPGADVRNAGVPGNTTRDMLARLDRDVLAARPDVVMLMTGINDSAWVDAGPRARSEPRVPLAEFRRNLDEIVRRVRDAGARMLMITPNPISRDYVYSGVGFYRDHDMNETLARYVAATTEAAATHGLPLVDVFHTWVSGNAVNRLLLDGIHPNPEGHAKIAALVFPALLALVRQTEAVRR